MKIRVSFSVLGLALWLGGCVLAPASSLPQETHNLPALSQESVVAQNEFSLPSPGNDVVGKVVFVKAKRGDTLSSIAEKYHLGFNALAQANPGINPQKTIWSGKTVVLPTRYVLPPPEYRQGIVINIPALRLYYFTGSTVMIFPVALGREGWRTPVAKTYVYKKVEAPTWNVPESIRQDYFNKHGLEHPTQIEPGPENPLGNYAIYLQMPGYLIHGTNNPGSIGRFVSSGCMRMYNSDVERLFAAVDRGTPVNIIYYTSLAGWQGNQLYLESHPEISHEDGLYEVQDIFPGQAVRAAMGERPHPLVNWESVQSVIQGHTGMPTMIGHNLDPQDGALQ